MNKSESISKLAAALSQFQGEVKNPSNTATNPQFRSKYAPLDVVINTVKPILAKYGLSFIQSTGSENETIIITTTLLHDSGEWLESSPLILPAYQLKGGGQKEFNAQGAGSAITYGRRYSLSAMLGISSEDDDDGNQQTVSPTSAQATAIKDKMSAKAAAAPVVGEIPDSLKTKYQEFKGSDDGMQKWVGDQMAKGKTYEQMIQTLQAGIDKKSQ